MDDSLKTAIARLTEFRASWNAGDLIDEDSKLTADDLDLLIARLCEAPTDTTASLRAE
jgi:hypothetical protein